MILSFCSHRKTSWPFWDGQRRENYVVCLSCSQQIPWAWQDGIELKPPRPTQGRKAHEKEMTGIERQELMSSTGMTLCEEHYECA